MVRVHGMQCLDDRGFRRAVDLADEIFRSFGAHRQPIEIASAAVDDVAGAARGLDRGDEHRMHDESLGRAPRYRSPQARILPAPDRAEMSALERIRVVLCAPSHPGNIGAAARAMQAMGLERLALVNPSRFPDPEAAALAVGAAGILDSAQTVPSL